ncbi:MAG: peptidase MA family metallohydrolase [Phycisphaerales bacterium]
MRTAWFDRVWMSGGLGFARRSLGVAALAAILACGSPNSAMAQDAKPATPSAPTTPALPAATKPGESSDKPQAAPEAHPAPDAEVAKLNVLIERMTKAVLATDIAGYMACVDRADPVFLQEQKNWAKDLERMPVSEFSIKAENFRAEVSSKEGPGEIIADLTMNWKIKDAGSARFLKYAGRFVDRKGEWLYAGEHWRVMEREGVRVFFDAGRENIAAMICEIMPGIRKHVHEGFALTIDRVQEIRLYSSMQHLQHSIYLSYTDGLSGWNEPNESIKMIASAHPDKEGMTSVLAHEYGHVCTFELGPRANDAPWWVLEGVAELSSESYDDNGQFAQRAVRRMAKNGRLRDWASLSDFHNTKQADMQMVYTQGHAMLGYISERFGREKRIAWLRAMATGSTIDDASKAIFDLSFTELDAQWRESLKPKEEAPAPAETPSKE